MRVSRVVVKNFRSLKFVDCPISNLVTCVVGENNTGKSCLIHALRLCLDNSLSSSHRFLTKDDVHSQVDRSIPFQVLIGVEFEGFKGNDNQEAMLHGTQIADDRARIFYRFRPKRQIREMVARGEGLPTLTLEDFSWELFGGGNAAIDLTDIEWNLENENLGAVSVGFQYLQSLLVVYLPALRDVESDLQQYRKSPLAQLIEASNISPDEQQSLISAVNTANQAIEVSPTIRSLSDTIDTGLKALTGEAFSMDIDLGLSDPSFQAIIKNIKVLLSSEMLKNFDPKRNGLGLNNILYISIWVEYFKKRAALGKAAGELLLIEEPEAHLHPQLQLTLLESLSKLHFQSILTTHSAHITAKAPLESFIFLTSRRGDAPYASTFPQNSLLKDPDVDDLERYLDSTKSSLLFARKVMLVEGAAEIFLIPSLVKKIMNIDLEREGISVIAIHGKHFSPYTKLFSDTGLPKKCAIVADGDEIDRELTQDDQDLPEPTNYAELENAYVKSFLGRTTFERELTVLENLPMLRLALEDLSAPRIKSKIELAEVIGEVDDGLKDTVLRTAKRFGKGRFSQVLARHIDSAGDLPIYIQDAVNWLLDDTNS